MMQKKKKKAKFKLAVLFILFSILPFKSVYTQNKHIFLGALKTMEFEGVLIFENGKILSERLSICPSDSSGKIDSTSNTNYFLVQLGNYAFIYDTLINSKLDSSCFIVVKLAEKKIFTKKIKLLKWNIYCCKKRHLEFRIKNTCSTFDAHCVIKKRKKNKELDILKY